MKVKKIISIMLCVSMICGILSVGATRVFASDEGECTHDFVQVSSIDATCNSHGETVYECSICGEKKTEYTSATTGYTWDFSSGSAESVNGDPKNTLSFFSSSGGDKAVNVTDGELVAHQTLMSMSQPVTLDSSNDWTVEIVAKGTNNGKNNVAIRTVFSAGRSFSEAKFIYITGTGDMLLSPGKQTMTTDDEYTKYDYVYYKTSDEDYEASVLNSADFDFTQYHTYQMKCTGGVFSTWVDGEKIGDLCMSEFLTTRSSANHRYTQGTGTPFDFSSMTMDYVGNGNAAGKATYGLTATVKYLGIYPGHSFDNVCDEDCNNDGCDYVREVTHSWDKGVVTVFPTETEEGVRTYTCALCGKTKEETLPCVSKLSYYVWDFSSNSQTTKGEPNTITVATTNYKGETVTNNGTMTVSNHRMDVNNAALDMSNQILLDSSKNWAVDFVMKAKVDTKGAAITPKVLFAEDKLFSVGTSAYLTIDGDIILAQKGTINGKNAYWYYMVSEADFNANMPENFDITKEHTYRLMCTNGAISFWLDGAKIGDLSVTCSTMDHSSSAIKYEGRYFEYSSINAKYIGNGNTGNIKTFGFTGDVDEIGFYTDDCELNFAAGIDGAAPIEPVIGYPGKTVTLPEPETGDSSAEFIGWNEKADGSGKMYNAGDTYEFSGFELQGLYGIWGGDITIETSGDASGTVTADAAQANYGDTVTLTVTPDDGSVLKNITAGDVELTKVDDATYTFTMPAHSVTVNAEFDFADGIGIHLAGHTISLDGDVAVNFYMELSEAIANSDTAYMQFSVPNTSAEYQNQTVMVSDAVKKGNYYIFNCRVAAKDMKSTITAKIIDDDQSGTEYTYSVKAYADYLIEHQNDSETYKNAVPLVQAMLKYGENAEYYFDKTSDKPEDVEATIPEKDYVEDSIPEGVSFDGASLSLKSQTTLSLYFDSDQDITLSAKDKKGNSLVCDYGHEDNEYVIRIRNISAKELNDGFTVTVEANGQSGTVTYSPMTYCYKVLMSDTIGDNLKNTVKALYLYWVEADKYFN